MRELSSCELLSHPEKQLVQHLSNVANLCRTTICTKKLNFETLDQQSLADIAFILGACHDFGKATSFFQQYIRETDEKRRLSLKNNPRTQHGLISAVFTYYVLKDYITEKDDSLFFVPIFGYLAVKRHHGNLDNPSFELVDLRDEDKIDVLKDQAHDIDLERTADIYQALLPTIDVSTFLDQIEPLCNEIRKCKNKLTDHLEKRHSPSDYILFQLLYSNLLNSDKMDASGLRISNDAEINPSLVDEYRSIKGWINAEAGIDKIRNLIYDDVLDSAEKVNLSNKIYSINVPTGTGKTLTSLSFAIKLRDKIKAQSDYTPKIIYSLPFLSIIDQNYSVFEDIFETVYDQKPNTATLLKHHHLSDIFYSSQDDEFKEDKALLLIEGWNSQIIVTTFVQLFHTLISNKNKALRKFHNIANSIVILDEVQSIPHEYWLLFKELTSSLSKHFNTYFIFVTATQPLIFDESKGEIIELAENKKEYFSQFDRIQLEYLPEPLKLEDFKEKVRQNIEIEANKDFLIVLNTITATKEVYNHLISSKRANTDYFYLSTHITPKERLKRIQQIKDSDKRKVIVSTQLIEAGVDIDVDVVYRDMSTLDSINQVSGRCNRNYDLRKKGDVKIFTLRDDRQEYHKYIYSGFLIDKTKEILKGTGKIEENQFLELNNKYFQNIKETQSKDKAKEILDAVYNLRFDLIKEKFRLIENEYEKTDVFIESDENASAIWQQFQELREISNPLERKNKFLAFKKQFYEYVISVPKSKAPALMSSDTGMGYIPYDKLNDWYNKDTGFISKDKGALIF
ncbi:MAG: CRISPR-associated endonuclease/helicase Cas3 [Thermotogaceae bacterium]|nr:CRISPR-associated endonuclease/helicase Cas3 [Methanolobus sp.]MDN5338596.1 CRISPR-associated endonuclease/helicase Cas3 [Thermotogaceae bacterium]